MGNEELSYRYYVSGWPAGCLVDGANDDDDNDDGLRC